MKGFKIKKTFEKLKKDKKKAFIPYIMAGDPNLEETLYRLKILEEAGADIIELGIPFTDPIADGPTIQRAAERALNAGTTLRKILHFLEVNKSLLKIPIIIMTYLNPVYNYGVEKFFQDARKSDVAGLIFPDLIVEESQRYTMLASENCIDMIFLVAPTSTPKRVRKIVRASTGFVYYVSMTGITGTELKLESSFKEHIDFVRNLGKPVCLGFGVSKPEEAKYLSQFADGIIVGSAIVKAFNENTNEAYKLIKSLREAI